MTTSKETKHRQEVNDLITSLDEENCQHMLPLIQHYREARWSLKEAIYHLNKLDGMTLDEGGYHELTMQLHSMLDALRSDEIALLELSSAMSTPSEVQS